MGDVMPSRQAQALSSLANLSFLVGIEVFIAQNQAFPLIGGKARLVTATPAPGQVLQLIPARHGRTAAPEHQAPGPLDPGQSVFSIDWLAWDAGSIQAVD